MEPIESARSEPSASGESAHYSGVVVLTLPDRLEACVSALEALRGVEVHYRHAESGRIVIVLEGSSAEEHLEMLQRIQALPDVMSVAPVYHYVDTNPEVAETEAESFAEPREH